MSAVIDLGLVRQPSMQRLEKLLRDRDLLLRKVARAQRSLANFSARVEREVGAIRSSVFPLIAKMRALSTEIRCLFDEILAYARRSPGVNKKVKNVFGRVEENLKLGAADEDPKPSARPFPHAGAYAELESAHARGAEEGQSSLRIVFKRVALALHPDRASSDAERTRCTELMKEVTRAYDEGDLAKLIELESTWIESAPPPSPDSEDEYERRCREIERLNRALRAQDNALTRELRTMKRKHSMSPFAMPVAEAVAMVERDLAKLVATRDLVKSYRDGTITLRQFMLGPPR